MLETTRIRREGYASRPLFADFVARYKVWNRSAHACTMFFFECGIPFIGDARSCRWRSQSFGYTQPQRFNVCLLCLFVTLTNGFIAHFRDWKLVYLCHSRTGS